MKNLQEGISQMALIGIVAVVVVAAGALFFISSGNNSQNTEDAMTEESMEGMNEETAQPPTEQGNPGTDGEQAMEEVEADVTIELDAFNFGYSEETITVQQGQTVKIVLTSSEGFHDWVVDELDAATQRINAGQTTEITFLASEAGEFEYYCSVGNHRQLGMVGTIVVE